MHSILFYEMAEGFMDRRAQYRDEHLTLARQAYERGELVLAGALANPADSAVLVFRGPTTAAAEAFAKADPYLRNGLVKSWGVRQWTTVIGEGSSAP